MPNTFTTRLSQRLCCFGSKPLDISPTPLRQHDIGSRSNLTTIQSDDEAEADTEATSEPETKPKRPPNSFRQAAHKVRQQLHENTITNTASFSFVDNVKHTTIIVEGIKSTALMEQPPAPASQDMSQKQKKNIPINPADTQVRFWLNQTLDRIEIADTELRRQRPSLTYEKRWEIASQRVKDMFVVEGQEETWMHIAAGLEAHRERKFRGLKRPVVSMKPLDEEPDTTKAPRASNESIVEGDTHTTSGPFPGQENAHPSEC